MTSEAILKYSSPSQRTRIDKLPLCFSKSVGNLNQVSISSFSISDFNASFFPNTKEIVSNCAFAEIQIIKNRIP